MAMTLATLVAKITAETSGFEAQMLKVTGQISDFANEAAIAGTVFTFALSRPLEELAKIGLGFDDMQFRATQAFTSMLGSGAAAQKMLSDLRVFAVETPFELGNLIPDVQRMKAMGFETEQLLPSIQAVGNALSNLGASDEVLHRVTYALGEMNTAGQVYASEMRQLTMAGIPAWKYLADSAGMTTAQIRKAVKDGLVPAKWAIQALTYQMQHNAPDGMKKMNKSLQTGWSNLKDAATQALGTLFDPLYTAAASSLQQLSHIALGMTNIIRGWSDDTKKAIIGVLIALALFGPALVILGGLGKAIMFLTSPVALLAAGFAYLGYYLFTTEGAAARFGRVLLDNLVPIIQAVKLTILTLAVVNIGMLISSFLRLAATVLGPVVGAFAQGALSIIGFVLRVVPLIQTFAAFIAQQMLIAALHVRFFALNLNTTIPSVIAWSRAMVISVMTFISTIPALIAGAGAWIAATTTMAITSIANFGRMAYASLAAMQTIIVSTAQAAVAMVTSMIPAVVASVRAFALMGIQAALLAGRILLIGSAILIGLVPSMVVFITLLLSGGISAVLQFAVSLGIMTTAQMAAALAMVRGIIPAMVSAIQVMGVYAMQILVVVARLALWGAAILLGAVPAIVTLITVLLTGGIPALLAFLDTVGLVTLAASTAFVNMARAAITSFIGMMIPAITGAVGAIIAALSPIIIPLLLIIAVMAALAIAWKNNWFGIQQVVQKVVTAIVDAVKWVWDWIQKIIPAVTEVFRAMGMAIQDTISVYVEGGAQLFKEGKKWWDGFMDFGIDIDPKKMLADAQKQFAALSKGLKIPEIKAPGALVLDNKGVDKEAKKLASAYARMLLDIRRENDKMEQPMEWMGKKLVQGSKQAEIAFEITKGALKGIGGAMQNVIMAEAARYDRLKLFTTLTKQYETQQQELSRTIALGSNATEAQRFAYDAARQSLEGLNSEERERIRLQQTIITMDLRRAANEKVLQDLRNQSRLTHMVKDDRDLINFAGGLDTWEKLGEGPLKLANGLTQAQQAVVDLWDAFKPSNAAMVFRDTMSAISTEMTFIGEDMAKRAAQMVGIDVWKNMSEGSQDALTHILGLQNAMETIDAAKVQGFKDYAAAFNPIKTAARDAELAIAEMLRITGLAEDEPILQDLLKQWRDSAKKTDEVTVDSKSRDLMKSLNAEALQMQMRLSGAYTNADMALQKFVAENTDLFDFVRAAIPDLEHANGIIEMMKTKFMDTWNLEQKVQNIADFNEAMSETIHIIIEAGSRNPFEQWRNSFMKFNEETGKWELPAWMQAMSEGEQRDTFGIMQQVELIQQAAQAITDSLVDAFMNAYDNGPKNFFRDVLAGFERMIYQMAVKWIAMQAYMALMKAAFSAAGISGEDLGITMAARGDQYAKAGEPFVVGERGPEMFVPRSAGAIVPNHKSFGGGRSQPINVYVTSPNADSFIQSRAAVASGIRYGLQQAQQRSGE